MWWKGYVQMKKPAISARRNDKSAAIIIKNPFLAARLEKLSKRQGMTVDELVVFFVRLGFDKPSEKSIMPANE